MLFFGDLYYCIVAEKNYPSHFFNELKINKKIEKIKIN